MKSKTKAILCLLLMSIFAATSLRAVAVEPSVGEVTISPSNPTALSNVTFTAKVTGDDINAVHLIYSECDSEICKLTKNTTMTETSEGTYEATINLAWDKANHITYYFNIYCTGIWTKTEYVNVTLTPSNGNHNGNGNTTNGDKSPGFEILLFVAAIGGSVILLARKRFK
jgi:hypothetical protein